MKIVIEVRGGVVQEVYSDVNNLNVILLDWDNFDSTIKESDGASVIIRDNILAETQYTGIWA